MSNSSRQDESVLSGEELEALSAETSSSVPEDGEFRLHDFGGGQSLSISRWSILDSLIEKHAESLGAVLSSEFDCEIKVSSHLKRFGLARDLLMEFPDRLCVVSSPIEPFEDESHLMMPGSLLTALVNIYFGGGSESIPTMSSRVTPSEQRVGERLAKVFLRVMHEIWSDRVTLGFSDLFVDVSPDRFTLIPPESGFVAIPFELSLDEAQSHEVLLLMPFVGMESLEEVFTPDRKSESQPPAVDSEWSSALQDALPNVNLGIRGELCVIEVTLRTLLAMRVGTTLPIEPPDHIKLLSGDRLIAEGSYGTFDGLKAMQFIQFEGDRE